MRNLTPDFFVATRAVFQSRGKQKHNKRMSKHTAAPCSTSAGLSPYFLRPLFKKIRTDSAKHYRVHLGCLRVYAFVCVYVCAASAPILLALVGLLLFCGPFPRRYARTPLNLAFRVHLRFLCVCLCVFRVRSGSGLRFFEKLACPLLLPCPQPQRYLPLCQGDRGFSEIQRSVRRRLGLSRGGCEAELFPAFLTPRTLLPHRRRRPARVLVLESALLRASVRVLGHGRQDREQARVGPVGVRVL